MPEQLIRNSIGKLDAYFRKPDTRIARILQRHVPEQGVVYRTSKKKAILDRSLAIGLSIPAIPVIGALALVKKFEDGGSAFYKSPRIGKDGVIFNATKIRTLTEGADQQSQANRVNITTPGIPYDTRATPIGQWLRRLRLDETPQLLQAAFGRHMSLIGMRADTESTWETIRELLPKTAGESFSNYTLTHPASFNPQAVFFRKGTLDERERLNTFYAQHASVGFDLYIFYRALARILLEKRK